MWYVENIPSETGGEHGMVFPTKFDDQPRAAGLTSPLAVTLHLLHRGICDHPRQGLRGRGARQSAFRHAIDEDAQVQTHDLRSKMLREVLHLKVFGRTMG